MEENVEKRRLEFGQTPWDNLAREELLRTVQRMWVALTGAENVLAVHSAGQPGPYWSRDGAGGRVLNHVRQIINGVEDQHDLENVYRAFFRSVIPLLFEGEPPWLICTDCGHSPEEDESRKPGNRCDLAATNKNCGGTYRKQTWEDLKPK